MTSLWPRLCSRLAPERALDPLCDLLCFGGFTFAVKKEQRPAPTLVGIILKYRSGNLSQPHPRHGCIHTADADVFRLPGRVVPLGIWQQMKPQGGLELNQTRLKDVVVLSGNKHEHVWAFPPLLSLLSSLQPGCLCAWWTVIKSVCDHTAYGL